MSDPSKAKGSKHEKAVRDYLVAHGFPHVERLAAGATLDRGDLSGVVDRDGGRWTVEVKCQHDQTPGNVASWCREAAAEWGNDTSTVSWLVVGKRWGTADVGASPVWLPMWDLVDLASGPPGSHSHVRLTYWADGLDADPDAGLMDSTCQITLRAWCLLAGTTS